MNNSKTYIGSKEAAQLMDCSLRKVQKMIRTGRMAAQKDGGKYFIDRSELFRVFPMAFKNTPEGKIIDNSINVATADVEVDYLKGIVEDKKKEIESLREQIKMYGEENKKLVEVVNSYLRLVESNEAGKKTKKGKFWSFRDVKD